MLIIDSWKAQAAMDPELKGSQIWFSLKCMSVIFGKKSDDFSPRALRQSISPDRMAIYGAQLSLAEIYDLLTRAWRAKNELGKLNSLELARSGSPV